MPERTSLPEARASLRVVAWPAFSTPINPYNTQLYQALQNLGVTVLERSVTALLWKDFDILHVHWPNFSWPRRRHGFVGSVLLLVHALAVPFALFVARIRGRKVVWTIHNLRAHDARFPNLASAYDSWLIRLMDAHISLSASAQAEALGFFPRLRKLPGFVIPHGHYCDAYAKRVERDEARRQLGIAPSRRVALAFGHMRRYKNLPSTIAAFERAGSRDMLLIAGQPFDAALVEEIQRAVERAAHTRVFFERISADRVPVFFGAADLALIPADTALNSGTAILALSFGVPILAVDRGGTRELRDLFGEEIVHLYSGALTSDIVQRTFDRIDASGPPLFPRAALDRLGWQAIGEQTRDAYLAISGRRHS